MEASADFIFSSYRERLIEHLFVGEVLRHLWIAGVYQVEVLRSEVDGAGYDVVFESQSIVRHVQLKAARIGGRRASVGVHVGLAAKPSGCVVWMYFDPKTLSLGPYLWFGNAPGEPLPPLDGFKVGKHTKGDSTGYKAERPNVRIIPKREFERLESVDEVVDRLFRGGTLKGEMGSISKGAPAKRRTPRRRRPEPGSASPASSGS